MDEKSESAKFTYHCIPPDLRIKAKQGLHTEAISPILTTNEVRKIDTTLSFRTSLTPPISFL